MMVVKKTKRSYRRSTPIGRLRRNVDKVSQQSQLLRARVSPWASLDSRAAEVEKLVSAVIAKAAEMDDLLAALEDSGFIPPEKVRIVTWEVGQRVAVAPKFRAKYEEAFHEDLKSDEGFLDDLVVESVLPTTGEIVVRRKKRSPFLVPKTHLVEAEERAGG